MSHESRTLEPGPAALGARTSDRRQRDRRRRTLYALLVGSFNQRRRQPRRRGENHVAAVDLHEARWLAVAVGIVLMSAADAFLTMALLERGATEANPVMALVVDHGPSFAWWKMSLTVIGVIVLTALARLRAFRRVPVGSILYGICAGYALLIGYELWMLEYLARNEIQ